MRIREPDKSLTLEELRQLISKHKEEGRKIVAELSRLKSHYEKMQEYYEAWEADLNTIQELITRASNEHNVPKEEVEEFDALEDLLGT